jgi:hypothetical protein
MRFPNRHIFYFIIEKRQTKSVMSCSTQIRITERRAPGRANEEGNTQILSIESTFALAYGLTFVTVPFLHFRSRCKPTCMLYVIYNDRKRENRPKKYALASSESIGGDNVNKLFGGVKNNLP